MNDAIDDPYEVLGLPFDADEHRIRQAYLAAVKQFPPDKDAEKFRQIHRAYQLLEDPMVQAEAVLKRMREPVSFPRVIERAARKPPRMPTQSLLALGNL